MDPMPLAGGFPATAQEAVDADRWPLMWLYCPTCGLVNVEPDVPDHLIYGTYSYAASSVPALVRHHSDFAAFLAPRYDRGTRFVEIGSNDGVLLSRLPADWRLMGVDPSDVARQSPGPWDLINEPFTSQLAAELPTADVVSSSNSFAHFTGIADALDGVARLLRPGGDFWLEVHDLDATLRSGQWDTIYHEHKVEWSASSLQSAICPLGFDLVGLVRLPLHGGLIRAHFRRRYELPERRKRPARREFTALRAAYRDRRPPKLAPASAAYGAAARGTVYLNQMPGLPVAFVVDGSPLRAGRFVPGLGVPIVTPEEFERLDPDTTLITAWNHAEDIMARHPRYGGEWVSAWPIRRREMSWQDAFG